MTLDVLPLTRTQARVARNTTVHSNRCAVYRLTGIPDVPRLERSLALVAAHCKPLRWRLLHAEVGSSYLLHEQALAQLEVIQVGSTDEVRILGMIDTLCAQPLRLDVGSPWSMTLLCGEVANYLVFVCHPGLLDRFSLEPLFGALSQAYSHGMLDAELGLDQQALLDAEQASLEPEQWRSDLAFWVRELGDGTFTWHPPRLEGDPGDISFFVPLGPTLSSALIDRAQALGVSTEFLLQISLHVLLQKLTRQSVVITAHAIRGRQGTKGLVGYDERLRFIRSDFDESIPLRQFLSHAAARFAMADFHANIPAGDVLDELKRLHPDYNIATTLLCERDYLPHNALRLGNLQGQLITAFCRHPEIEDASIYLRLEDDIGLDVHLRHPQSAQGLRIALEHYVAFLSSLDEQLDVDIDRLNFDTAELDAQRRAWSFGTPLSHAARDVLASFDEVVQQQPGTLAVKGEDADFTYAELATHAAHIAQRLAGPPVTTGLVGICLSRGARVIPAMLGVLAIDAGYVPLDPLMPEERLRFMAEDAQLSAVIADASTAPRVRAAFNCPTLLIEDLLDGAMPVHERCPSLFTPSARPSLAAYVIYTSGTTGRPKGVVIERGMLAHLLAALEGRYERGPGTRWLQFASVNFDASVLEIFNPLTHGGTLVIAPDRVRTDPAALFAFLSDERISHTFLPPAVLRLLPRRPLPELDTILCGGEASDDDTVRFWSSVLRLSNIYGPTETTVIATENTFGDHKLANQLGRPLPGYSIHLLDAHGQAVPLGAIGEICIGGDSVAQGYLRRPDLSAQKFLNNADGYGRLYRSGDLGRFLPNGDIEFLGRDDFQVKVRGYRIEIAEVEQVIAALPEVSAVYIGTQEHQGSLALVAWYSAQDLSPAQLRQRVETRLPAYMIPAFLVPVQSWPLTLNGKIDRARLPAPCAPIAHAPTPDLDPLESTVRTAWAATLGTPEQAIDEHSHFFEAGGHSLLATLTCNRIGAALGKSVKPGLLLSNPGFAAFCRALREAHQENDTLPALLADSQALQGVPVESGIVQAIWHRARLNPSDNAYSIIARLDFSPEVNPLTLHAALIRLFDRDPLFKARLTDEDGEVRLVLSATERPTIAIESATTQSIAAQLETWRITPIAPNAAPAWRARLLLNVDSGTSTVLLSIHHALFDGWSLKLLLEELAALYENRSVPERALNWFDYCAWQGRLKHSPLHARDRAYWLGKLGGVSLRTDLPMDATTRQADANQTVPLQLTPERTRALQAIAQAQGTTLSPVLFALHLVWLWRLTGQPMAVSGYPQAGRDLPGSETLYGMLVSMAVMRQPIDPRQRLGDLVKAVHTQMLEDREHLLATPYEAGVNDIGTVNVLFSLQSGIELNGRIGEGRVKVEELPSKTAKTDLSTILYRNAQGGIDGRIEYDASLFTERSIQAMKEVFETLLEAATQTPDALIGELPYLSETQRTRVTEFSCGLPLNSAQVSIPNRFASIVARFGERTALRFENEALSYDELHRISDRIASGLLEQVAPGACVGLSMVKGPYLVATVLGVLKAGCAYVPLDASYPAQRLQHFVANCSLTTCIADAQGLAGLTTASLQHLRILNPADLANASPSPLPKVSPSALAYVIHTSGSTGNPKGVLIEHHTVVRMIEGAAGPLEYGANCISTLMASINFDASVLEIFLALLQGGTLVIVPEALRQEPTALHQLLVDERVTHALLAPVLLQGLPQQPLPDLRMLAFGGDTLEENVARWWAARTRLLSLYGPTEITVMASCGQVQADGPVRILGKPLPGYRVYLLNAEQQPVPPGTIGELFIGSDNLARGYRNEPELTLRRFTGDPFAGKPYARMYRTGDLGRYLPDGTIEYLGRNDAQIKLRGFRIELGEIESRLALMPGIQNAVCTVCGANEQRYLAAYYVPVPDADIDEEALRQHMQAGLPDYMLPARYVRLECLPLSGSGKIDRKALPVPSTESSGEPPRAGLEKTIADIWRALLQLESVSREDNFFHLGGNSILVIRMHERVRSETGFDFALPAFYRSPTIAGLVSGGGASDIERAMADAAAPLPTPPALLPPWHESDAASIATVLLTGASGFVGIHLLDELSRRVPRVLCLQRCETPATGLERLKHEAHTAGLSIDFSRVEVLPADLARPILGLSTPIWKRLAEEVDAILHCGAQVHHLHGYDSLKAANVGSTQELLRLALSIRQKPLCFLSTMSVPLFVEGVQQVEERPVTARPTTDNGYLLGKWVSEQRIAACAQQYGLPASIVRVGNVTGDSHSGYSNYRNNHFWLFNQGCIQLSAYPATGQVIEMTPVDVLAQAICALILNPREGLEVFNLQSPRTIPQDEWFAMLDKQGLVAHAEPPEQWQKRLATIDPSNGLMLLRDFYTGDLTWHDIPVQQRHTLDRLENLGVSLVLDSARLVERYVGYLRTEGFLPVSTARS